MCCTIDSRHMRSIILFIHENGPCRKIAEHLECIENLII